MVRDDLGEGLEKEGVYVCIYIIWLIHIATQRKLTQHWEAIILQLKIFKKHTASHIPFTKSCINVLWFRHSLLNSCF